MVAWSGLGIPISLSAEQHEALKSKYAFPSGGNKKLQEFFQVNIIQGLFDQGYDPTKHYRTFTFPSLNHIQLTCFCAERQTIMVLPEYHGMGLGTMLTEKINSVADEAGGIIYARARLGAAALFYREGYEGLKKVAYDLKDFGVDDEGGKLKTKTAVFIFKRQPGAKSDRGRKLDLDFEKE
jgi:hypothetical protein